LVRNKIKANTPRNARHGLFRQAVLNNEDLKSQGNWPSTGDEIGLNKCDVNDVSIVILKQ
jgi:hypothetical protein